MRNEDQRARRRTPYGDAHKASRQRMLKSKYGLTAEDYNQMLMNQGGRCSICRRLPKRGTVLHVDHDHGTQAVRGLLCGECNTGLGLFHDDIVYLEAAIRYLTGASDSHQEPRNGGYGQIGTGTGVDGAESPSEPRFWLAEEGYSDGGEAYSDAELEAINKLYYEKYGRGA